ncbi:MAG TPA: hypothetical protein VF690_19760 [Hymenobacter sp.]|jgi:hypothetical protein
MKHSRNVFWLLLWLSCSAASCEKDVRVEGVRLSFEVPLAIAPARAAYALGDTLWLEADFSDTVQVFNGPGRYRLRPEQFNFNTVVSFQQFVSPARTLAEQPGAGSSFAVVSRVGAISPPGRQTAHLDFVHANGRYRARVGLIPRQRGVFGLSFVSGSSGIGRTRPVVDLSFLPLPNAADGTKRVAELEFILYPVNEGQTNLSLLRASATLTTHLVPTPANIAYQERGMYTFVVQ